MNLKFLPLAIGVISLQASAIVLSAQSFEKPTTVVDNRQMKIAAAPEFSAGSYTCGSVVFQYSPYGGTSVYQPGEFGTFILDGKGKYSNKAYKTSGRYDYNAQAKTLTFAGGKFDGYIATVKADSSTGKLRFQFKDRANQTKTPALNPGRTQTCG